MARKSTKYDTPDAGGWMNMCDDLFLAQFRGRPCEICGVTHAEYNGRKIRSMGHHLAEKGNCRAHRYNPFSIVVLCVNHHSQFTRDISPHADFTPANARFYDWLRDWHIDKYNWLLEIRGDPFDGEWTYREMYEELGGKIKREDKDGNKLAKKYWKPMNHTAIVREIEGEVK